MGTSNYCKPGYHGRGKTSNRLPRKALGLGYQVLHHPGPKITTKLSIFLKFYNEMKKKRPGLSNGMGVDTGRVSSSSKRTGTGGLGK
jgi:hypothetical protein